jgi:hypothetical protein
VSSAPPLPEPPATPGGPLGRAKALLARKITSAVAPALDLKHAELAIRLDRVEGQLRDLVDEVRQLKQIAEVQVDVVTESTALLGRIQRSTDSRLDGLVAANGLQETEGAPVAGGAGGER